MGNHRHGRYYYVVHKDLQIPRKTIPSLPRLTTTALPTIMSSHLKSPPAITLYRGFKGSGVYVWSPFVNKLEARFRLAGLPYLTDSGSPMQGPKGKIPYIGISTPESQTPTRFLGDSTLIIAQLVEEGRLDDLNAKLSPMERVMDLAIRALLEDKLYFYQVRSHSFHSLFAEYRHCLIWSM
jgi:hypothetical protein